VVLLLGDGGVFREREVLDPATGIERIYIEEEEEEER
jgi:hypothetical protein